jgi:signal transduction histidine kinase
MTVGSSDVGVLPGLRNRRPDRRWAVPVARAAAVVSALLVGTAVTGAVVAGLSLPQAVDGFVVTNVAMAVSFALCGWILATRRPGNPIGWLFLADGIGHGVTAAAVPLIMIGVADGWPAAPVRAAATVAAYAWPWSIALFLPLALLLFPTGRLPGAGWRWLLPAAVLTAPLFVVEVGADPDEVVPGAPPGYLTIAGHDDLSGLWLVAELRTVLLYAVCLAALAVRYRRGDERRRRQLLWPAVTTLVTVCVLVPWGVFVAGPVLILLAIPLVGVAVTIAVLRYQLLDIRLVLSRTVLYLLLTGAVMATHVVLVAVFDSLLRRQGGLGTSVLATVVIAVGFNPVRVRLQALVDRALYGSRTDPVRAASQVSARLVTADAGLGGVVEALTSALRLPFAQLRESRGEIASSGTAPEHLHAVPLVYGTQRVGELVVGLRAGQRRLDPADHAVLQLIAVPLSVAVFATALSGQLQQSRERIIGAREEERRRLRRDLHDGLGPTLTGVTLQADLARTLIPVDPDRAAELLTALRRQAGAAIDDIRRVAYGLRPPALDELGLPAALRQQIVSLDHRPDGRPVRIDLHIADTLPDLPAAVESAAYRITVEAVTNAVRHSGAEHVRIRLTVAGELTIEVHDDGAAADGRAWRAGVGLRSMAERAVELGGSCQAGPTDDGGLVRARLPLGTTP